MKKKNDSLKSALKKAYETGSQCCQWITKYRFELPKQQFWDSVSLRYGWEITNPPTFCPCGSKFDIQHRLVFCQFLDLRGNIGIVKEKMTRKTCFSRE